MVSSHRLAGNQQPEQPVPQIHKRLHPHACTTTTATTIATAAAITTTSTTITTRTISTTTRTYPTTKPMASAAVQHQPHCTVPSLPQLRCKLPNHTVLNTLRSSHPLDRCSEGSSAKRNQFVCRGHHNVLVGVARKRAQHASPKGHLSPPNPTLKAPAPPSQVGIALLRGAHRTPCNVQIPASNGPPSQQHVPQLCPTNTRAPARVHAHAGIPLRMPTKSWRCSCSQLRQRSCTCVRRLLFQLPLLPANLPGCPPTGRNTCKSTVESRNLRSRESRNLRTCDASPVAKPVATRGMPCFVFLEACSHA